MIKVDGKYLRRNGDKIGYLMEDDLFDNDGEKVGYYDDDHIYDKNGHKAAYLQDNYICFINSSHKIRIEENNKDIVGGDLTNIERAMVRALLGE